MDKPKTVESNDWDNEDDWEDWEDAQENFEDGKNSNKNNNNKVINTLNPITTNDSKDTNCNQPEQEIQSPREENRGSSSWASMLKPFGGVVTSITATVSQGINQVIGVPDPEELARMNVKEAAKMQKTKSEELVQNIDNDRSSSVTGPAFGIGLVTGVTSLGSKVLNTGLDTLEGIGKKTMTILQENDPLLKNKRKLLGLESERPNLSAVLQEAKKDADQLENTLKQLQIEKSKMALHFEPLFENHCGLVHLETLEILSKESTLKLEKLLEAVSGQALHDLQETIHEVKELMELEDLEVESEEEYTARELNEFLTNAIEDAELKITFDDIVKIWSTNLEWLEQIKTSPDVDINSEEIFAKGLTALAETCALQMNKLHKIAELLLVKDHHSTANEVDAVVQLCKQFTMHLHGLSNRFATTLSQCIKENNAEDVKSLTSTLFSEMLLATQQIEKAFNLFLPILQIGAA